MAQLNITLNQDEILQLLSNNRDDAFKTLLQESLNSILKAESTAQLGAEKYERSVERTDSRNGSRERQLHTRVGTIDLVVPRHRNVPFKTLIFDNYSRSEAALISSMAEMVINGVSTRKVSKVVETLCGTAYSKSTVSEVCKDLDQVIDVFRNRPIEGVYPFLMVDATYFKVRENHRIVSKALFIAYATNKDARHEVIGFEVYDNESNDTWLRFFTLLKKRGLSGVRMITSDAHQGIVSAISKVFPEVPWQRCQTHFSRNILEKVPAKYQKGLQAELLAMYNTQTIEEARKIKDSILDEYTDLAPASMECLDNGFESIMTVMALPEKIRRFHRTSNHIERLNRELKRRSNVIGVFPNVESIIRIMGSVLMEYHDKMVSAARLYTIKVNAEVEQCVPKLKEIAMEQQKLLAA
ncbi:MAG: IS256 family transposase [Roseburia sp.]